MRRKMSVSVFVFSLAVVLLLGASATAVSAREPVVIIHYSSRFGTGGYNLGSAIEKVFKEVGHSWLRFKHEAGGGGPDNFRRVLGNDALKSKVVANSSLSSMLYAYNGVKPFQKAWKDALNLKVLYGLKLAHVWLVNMGEEPMNIKDLDGKRVGLGRATQDLWAVGPRNIMEKGWGIKPDVEYLGPMGGVDALLDGIVKAATVGAYSSGDLATWIESPVLVKLKGQSRTFSSIDMGKQEIVKAMTDLGVPGAFVPTELKAGTVNPGQENPLIIATLVATHHAHTDMPEDVAYEYTKFILENHKKLIPYAKSAETLTPATMVFCPKTLLGADTYHPGAIKAYKEAGVWPE